MKILALAVAVGMMGLSPAFGALSITNTSVGGTGISLDTSSQASGGGTYTALAGINMDEASTSDFPGSGNIIITAPAGFRFDTTSTPIVTLTSLSGNSGVAPTATRTNLTATQIHFSLSRNTPIGNRLWRAAFSGIKVQPTTSAPAAGNMVIQVTTVFTGNIPLSSISGSISAQSTLSISHTDRNVGEAATITLQAKDQFGNNLTNGGATVVLSKGAGTSDGTISAVTDNNGTYTATFTANHVGTARTISATVNGAAAANTVTIKVNGMSVQSDLSAYTVNAGDQWILTVSVGSDSLPVQMQIWKNGAASPFRERLITSVDAPISTDKPVYEPDAGNYTIQLIDPVTGDTNATSAVTLTVVSWPAEFTSTWPDRTVLEGQPLNLDAPLFIGSKPRIFSWYYRPTVGSGSWTLLRSSVNPFSTVAVTTQAHAGEYKISVNNFKNDELAIGPSERTCTVTIQAGPPVITRQPRSVSAFYGSPARLKLEAAGTVPLAYQWEELVDGSWAPVPGETSPSLTIPFASETRSYRCRVSNEEAVEGIVSDVATITVDSTYAAAAGSYAGLVMSETLSVNSVGSLTLTLKANGTISGNLITTDTTNSFYGTMDEDGNASLNIDGKNLTLSTSLATAGIIIGKYDTAGDDNVELLLSNGSGLDGKYYILVPGALDSSLAPGGTSYLEANVVGSTVTIFAKMADNSSFKQITALSSDNRVPVFGRLFSGTNVVIGWLDISNPDSGSLHWIASGGAGVYSEPFSLNSATHNSPYVPADTAVAAGNYTVTISGAHVPNPVAAQVNLGPGNTITYLYPRPNAFTLVVNADGSFTGNFRIGSNNVKYFGVLDQDDNAGDGYFVTPAIVNPDRQSGLVVIERVVE